MAERKTRVAVLFGGRSAEHEVSIESARSVLAALDPRRYEALPVAITPEGRWLPVSASHQLLAERPALGAAGAGSQPLPEASPHEGLPVASPAGAGQPFAPPTGVGRCAASPPHAAQQSAEPAITPTQTIGAAADGSGRAGLAPLTNQLPEATAGLREADVVIPLVHGTYGEDGTLQGVLEFAGVPYVGAGVASSAIGMDKHLMKLVLRAAGLPILDWLLIERHAWRADAERLRAAVAERIGYPCFVKPSNMGSSVGVHKVHGPTELDAAVADADRFDTKVLVERAAQDAREIECSVLGNHHPEASVPGEIVPEREFYDYRAKYLEESSRLLIPAPLAPGLAAQVQRLAIAGFRALDCSGMARVDFFLEGDALWLNELNTIPGFTRISMYPKLWEASGVSYAALLDRLIALALERHAERRSLVTRYAEA